MNHNNLTSNVALVGLIAVWGMHHDSEDTIARTERNPLINTLTFGLLFHVEHHLYPAVPTNHLPELARRLDKYAPQLTKNRVVPTTTNLNFKQIKSNVEFGIMNKHNNNSQCPFRRRLI